MFLAMDISDLLLTSRIISGAPIQDLDVVVVDGRPLVVCVDSRGQHVFTWDPAGDRWAEHALDIPDGWSEGLLNIGAVVLDGRVVVGGGCYRQGFAQWDLSTGAVRTAIREDHGGLASVSTAELAGRSLFLCGDSSVPAGVRAWDAAERDVPETGRMAEPVLDARQEHFDGIGGIAAGVLDGDPVVVSGGWDGAVVLWGLGSGDARSYFETTPVPVHGAGLAAVDRELRVVAAGGASVLLGDPETGEWERMTLPGAPVERDYWDGIGIRCLDVGVVNGMPVAVTGTENGRVCAWDLQGRRLLGKPVKEHRQEVYAVRIFELDGRSVAVTGGQDGMLRVWGLG